jgi:UDP-N-acetylmuramoyl-tripeptide--D-alanyl-D-alanine ligase
MFSKEDLIKATNAVILKDSLKEEQEFSISTDTRTITPHDIYLPLKGENFDGEKFLNKVETGIYFTSSGIITDNAKFVLKVENTKDAYINIAKFYREKINPITVGITGSSGKTTTKEIVFSVLSQKFKTQKTYSNHNNEIGFCQTVLGMDSDTEALIVEMGMRGLGEIEIISKPLQPDFAIITNSGSAHVGRLGSLDNIAIAKCEITSGLKKEGTFIALNQDIIKKHVKFDGEQIYYSIKDVKILDKSPSYSKFEYKGEIYELNVEGDYNIENSLSAIELGLKLKMTPEEIRKGLFSYHPIEKRWEVEEIGNLKFINDSYNANPESMKASVKTFLELYEEKIVILGDMGELGENSEKYHTEVGEYLAKVCKSKNVKFLTVGNLAKKIGEPLANKGFTVKNFTSNEDVSCYILENLNKSYTIFLKASRSMKFEEIIDLIRKGIDRL